MHSFRSVRPFLSVPFVYPLNQYSGPNPLRQSQTANIKLSTNTIGLMFSARAGRPAGWAVRRAEPRRHQPLHYGAANGAFKLRPAIVWVCGLRAQPNICIIQLREVASTGFSNIMIHNNQVDVQLCTFE